VRPDPIFTGRHSCPNLGFLLAPRPPKRTGENTDTDHVRAKTVVTSINRISDRTPTKEACLVVIYGSDLGRKFNLDAATLVLGR